MNITSIDHIEYVQTPKSEADRIRWHLQHHVNKLNDRDVTRALMNYKPEGESETPAEQDKAIFL